MSDDGLFDELMEADMDPDKCPEEVCRAVLTIYKNLFILHKNWEHVPYTMQRSFIWCMGGTLNQLENNVPMDDESWNVIRELLEE